MDPLDHLRSALADRYVIEREIGRGGMAIVYRAHDLVHSRDVAVKVLRPEFAMAVSAERFLREIQIEGQLKHPYILPLFDSGDANGLLYYVMPHVPGRSLQTRLASESQLSIAEAVRIATEVAQALGYAHSLGFVHRDVKPGNILLGEDHALLADFGIARAITELAGDRLSESGVVVGTPEYMSPEQGAAHGRVDGRSDVYSLGCVLYEMLSGEPPFTGATAQAVIARHMHEAPRSLRVVRSAVPEHIETAIQVALAKVPADRFETMDDLVAAVSGARNAAPISHQLRKARHRKLRRAGVVGSVLVVSLGLLKSSVETSSSMERGPNSAGAPSLSSIAVLYLDNRSADGKLDHLAAGLTEDLIDQLAAVKSLRVISPNGVRQFRGRDVPLDSLARAFGVGTLVTGTLSSSGDRLRASVRLTDAASSVQLYGGTFEGRLGDLLSLRDQMAQEVARQLRIRLGEAVQLRERRSGAANAVAWNLVRQAEQLRQQILDLSMHDSVASATMFEEADSLLVEAESLDRNWIEPPVLRGWLAYDQADKVSSGRQVASGPVETWISRGIQHADRALQKAGTAPEVQELRGSLLYRGWALTTLAGVRDTTNQLLRAERDLRFAASLPHRYQARSLSTLSAVQQFLGKSAEANLSARRAYAADAYLQDARAILLRLFNTSLELKRYAEAADWCRRGGQTFPQDWVFSMCRLSLMAWSPAVKPNVKEAWAILAEVDNPGTADVISWVGPQMRMVVAAVLARAGLHDSAEHVIARAKTEGWADSEIPYYEALARMRLGQPERAAELLEDLIRRTPNFLPLLRSHSQFKPLWERSRLRVFQ